MERKFNLEALRMYGRLVADFVPTDAYEDFFELFSGFLNTYDADSKAESPSVSVDINLEPDEQRTIPKPGEIYEDDCGGRFEVLDVIADFIVITKSVTVLKKNENLQIGTLEKFNRYLKPKKG